MPKLEPHATVEELVQRIGQDQSRARQEHHELRNQKQELDARYEELRFEFAAAREAAQGVARQLVSAELEIAKQHADAEECRRLAEEVIPQAKQENIALSEADERLRCCVQCLPLGGSTANPEERLLQQHQGLLRRLCTLQAEKEVLVQEQDELIGFVKAKVLPIRQAFGL